MSRNKHKNNKEVKIIAKEKIKELFERAKKVFSYDKELANRYVLLARKISMKARTRIQSEYKRLYCKHCNKYLMPGQNSRVRINGENIIYYCFECRRFNKFGYKSVKKNSKVALKKQ